MEEDDESGRAKDRKELADFLAKVDEIGTYVVTRLRERQRIVSLQLAAATSTRPEVFGIFFAFSLCKMIL